MAKNNILKNIRIYILQNLFVKCELRGFEEKEGERCLKIDIHFLIVDGF